MKRVTGIGGIFFKANDPAKLCDWYEKHLGIKLDSHGQGATFTCDGTASCMTVWSIFPRTSTYFDPSTAGFMINYRVDKMDQLLGVLESEGIKILGRQDESYGRFAWIMDPEGNRIELWEPLSTSPSQG